VSQEALAERLGVSRGTASGYERRGASVLISTLAEIAKALGGRLVVRVEKEGKKGGKRAR